MHVLTYENYKCVSAFSMCNKHSLEQSLLCGCYFCCNIYSPTLISEFVDEDEEEHNATAICPMCGVDWVIAEYDYSHIIDKGVLEHMHRFAFRK